MRLPSRRSDDADVIRARLRALLAEASGARGWLPDDDALHPSGTDGSDEDDSDDWGVEAVTVPVHGPPPALPAGIGRHRAPGRTPRWDPGRPGARALWAAALIAAVVVIGWTWLDRPTVEPAPVPRGAAATSTPARPSVGEVAETSPTVVVSVVGSVTRPGLVTLPVGSRVAAALEAAGGLAADADGTSVNLAAVVTDGQQIVVGGPGAVVAGDAAGAASGTAPTGRVNLNTATAAELDALPGVGPVLAQRIVDHRTQGPFTSVDQLDDVPGIGPARAAELAELVTV